MFWMTLRASDQADIACHVTSCRRSEYTRVQSALDDVMSKICQVLPVPGASVHPYALP